MVKKKAKIAFYNTKGRYFKTKYADFEIKIAGYNAEKGYFKTKIAGFNTKIDGHNVIGGYFDTKNIGFNTKNVVYNIQGGYFETKIAVFETKSYDFKAKCISFTIKVRNYQMQCGSNVEELATKKGKLIHRVSICGGRWNLLHGIPVLHNFAIGIEAKEIHGDIFIITRPNLMRMQCN